MIDPEFTDANSEPYEFRLWIAYGYQRGWIGEPCCGTHDMPDMSDHERDLWEDDPDLCLPVVRVWGPGGMEAWNKEAMVAWDAAANAHLN